MDEPAFFGDVLRRLADERGLSVRKLADVLTQTRGVVHSWLQGKTVPNIAEAERVDRVLDAGGILAAAARMPGANGAGERLAYVARKPRSVDSTSVKAFSGVLANMRRLEDSLGAEQLIVMTAEPLRVVQNLADEARGDIRESVVDLAGQWAQFAGWLRAASGRPEQAREWYARTLEHATEAGSEDLAATSLSMRGNLAWMARRPGPLIGLSARAAELARSPGVKAMAEQQEARGHALLHEADPVDELLDAAEERMAKAAEHPEDEPPWTYFYSPGYLDMQRGLAYRLLGRKEEAIARLEAGLAVAGGELAGAEFVAEYRLQLAEAHLEAGDRDVAEDFLNEVRIIATATGSSRLAAEVDRLVRMYGI